VDEIGEVEGFGPKLAAELHAFLARPTPPAAAPTNVPAPEPEPDDPEPSIELIEGNDLAGPP
jgi:hypothetical protein